VVVKTVADSWNSEHRLVRLRHVMFTLHHFWATVCTVVLTVLSCLSVCDVGALWPNGWRAGRPRPRRICVRWGPRSTLPKKGGEALPPIFGPCLLWQNSWMDQDGTWYGDRPQPGRLCVRWGPSYPPPKKGRSPLPNFRPISIVAKRLDASRCHLV